MTGALSPRGPEKTEVLWRWGRWPLGSPLRLSHIALGDLRLRCVLVKIIILMYNSILYRSGIACLRAYLSSQ